MYLLLNVLISFSFSIENCTEDFIMLFSAVDMNSDTEMCTLFPTKGYIYSPYPLESYNWTIPYGCTKTNEPLDEDNHSSTVIFVCSESDKPYVFNIEASNSQGNYINRSVILKFKKCSDFHWYGFVKNSNQTGRQIVNGSELLLWPISVAESTNRENDHTASSPSNISIQYALSIHDTLGSPEISLLSLEGSAVSYVWNENTYFNSEINCWTTTIFFSEWNDFNIQITSQDRFQANEAIRVSYEYFCPLTVDFRSVFTNGNFNATLVTEFNLDNISDLHIFRHPCVQSTAFVRSGPYIIATIDDFDSFDAFLIDEPTRNITSLILTTSGISWIEDGFAYQLGYRSNITTSSELDENVTTLKTLFSCNSLTNTENIVDINDIIVAANVGGNTDHFYYTTDGWKTSYNASFEKEVLLLDFELIISGHGIIVFYYRDGSESFTRVFRFENHIDGTFNGTFDREISFNDSGLNKVEELENCFLTSNSIGQIFFVGSEIYVSTDIATTFLPIRLISYNDMFGAENFTREGNSSNLSDFVEHGQTREGMKVRDIVFSRSCKCAIIFQTGEIFILYPSQDYFVQIQALGGRNSYLRFDNLERVTLINFREHMSSNATLKYPILVNSEIDVFEDIYHEALNIKCPYIAFDVDLPEQGLAYIDKQTVVKTTTTIISDEEEIDPLVRATGEVAVLFTQKTLKSANFDSEQSTYSLLKQVEVEVNLSAVHEGFSYLFISPSCTTYNCGDSAKILNVFVGCPKGRNVRLKGGNDIFLFYSKTQFKPELELYDYDTYVQDVDADFAVYMINRTEDISMTFCQTAKSVGCIKKPQKWSDFIQNGTIWNHTNYESCFVGEPENFEDEEYNIMNKSDQSCIVLMPKNKKYTFMATVLDPNFSYCFLSTEFTVTVYGEPMHYLYSLLIVLGVLIICLFGFIITHIILNNNFKRSDRKIE